MEHWKKGREKVMKKEEGKWKALGVFANKKGKSIFLWRKTFQLQNLFTWVNFLPLHHTISKTLSKNIWENFATFFDHPLTWQYTWLELSIPICSTNLSFTG
jgi:hypothetical protein